jgi:hypothetical protein
MTQETIDPSQRRGTLAEFSLETIEGRTASFRFDQHAAGLIFDRTGELQTRRETAHERAEANSLHNSFDGDGSTLHRAIPRPPRHLSELGRPRTCILASPK